MKRRTKDLADEALERECELLGIRLEETPSISETLKEMAITFFETETLKEMAITLAEKLKLRKLTAREIEEDEDDDDYYTNHALSGLSGNIYHYDNED